MAENPQMPVEFYPLAQGHLPGLPPGTLVPGSGLPPWRDMLSLRAHDGELRLREPVVPAVFSAPSYTLNNATYYSLPILAMEIPLSPFFGSGARFLVITTMDWWLLVGSTWNNVTPQHSTGTVAVAGTAVTGTGTAWSDRGIKPGDLILLAGAWYYISAVNSNTSLTLASSAGVIGAGAAYTIRRTMLAQEAEAAKAGAFAKVLNGDIYVAGLFGGGRTFGSATDNIMDGAVIRIIGGATETTITLTGAANIQYLCGGQRELEVGIDFEGFNFIPLGLELLEDGRLVVPCHWVDFATGGAGGNRLLYSSHLSVGIWTTAPAGFTDIVQRAGPLTGSGRIGRSLTIHFTDQIRLGEPTGQDDPPLAFPETAATIGAIGARTIRQTPLGELFLGHDGNLYAFDGSRAEVVEGAQFWHHLRTLTPGSYRATFAAVDRHRDQYSLFYADASSIHNRTYELRFNYATRQLTRHSYPFRVHSVVEGQLSINATAYTLQRSTRARFFGVASFGNSASSNLIYVASDDPTTTQADSVPNVDNLSAETPYAETDDLDFGRPLDLKVVERVLVWCRAGAFSGAETLECTVYSEGSSSGIAGVASAPTMAGTAEKLFTFFFDTQPARLWRIRIGAAAADSNFIARPIRMVAYAAPAGDARAA